MPTIGPNRRQNVGFTWAPATFDDLNYLIAHANVDPELCRSLGLRTIGNTNGSRIAEALIVREARRVRARETRNGTQQTDAA